MSRGGRGRKAEGGGWKKIDALSRGARKKTILRISEKTHRERIRPRWVPKRMHHSFPGVGKTTQITGKARIRHGAPTRHGEGKETFGVPVPRGGGVPRANDLTTLVGGSKNLAKRKKERRGKKRNTPMIRGVLGSSNRGDATGMCG